jgi:hypothetical protein
MLRVLGPIINGPPYNITNRVPQEGAELVSRRHDADGASLRDARLQVLSITGPELSDRNVTQVSQQPLRPEDDRLDIDTQVLDYFQ